MDDGISEATLRIFISHKMATDGKIAEALGEMLLRYSGNGIEILSAEKFHSGKNLEYTISSAIARSNMFILLYTAEEENWQYCLLEAGKFLALTEGNKDRQIVVMHPAIASPPSALRGYNSVPLLSQNVFRFLNMIYRQEPWGINRNIQKDALETLADEIVGLFAENRIAPYNFDTVPNFSIEFANSQAYRSKAENGEIAQEATLKGSTGWEVLFEKDIDIGTWRWGDLADKWATREIYEYEIARMIAEALNNKAPEGCYIRPNASQKLYRLTLRRYEEVSASKSFIFYFTASPINIPVFDMDIEDKQEANLYHLLNMSWYARRRLVDKLYNRLRKRLPNKKQFGQLDADIVQSIKNELVNIEIQSVIRGIFDPGDVDSVKHVDDILIDQQTWLDAKNLIFESAKKSPPDLDSIAIALYGIAKMNHEYYILCSQKFADIAQRLKEVLPPRVDAAAGTIRLVSSPQRARKA